MSASRRLLIIGGLLLLAGQAAGFWPLSSGGAKCGSAFNPASPNDADMLIEQMRIDMGLSQEDSDCNGDRGDVRTIALVLLVAGCASGVAGWATARAGKRTESSPSA